jgi:hypothetical protein
MSATSTNSDLFTTSSTHIPAELQYNANNFRKAIPARREVVKLTSDVSTPSPASQNRFHFTVPNYSMLRSSNTYMSFKFVCSGTGGSYVRNSNGIHTIFERMRITLGSLVVEDLEDCNLLQSAFYQAGSSADWQASVGEKYGFGSTTERNSMASGKRFAIPIFSDFFSYPRDLPLMEIDVPLKVEFTLANPEKCLESDHTSALTYSLSDCKLVCEMVDIHSQEVKNQLATQLKKNPVHIPYRTFSRYVDTISGTSNQIKINSSHSNVKFIMTVMRTQADISDETVNDKFITYNYNGLNSLQLRVNGRLHPQEAIECREGASELYQELLKVLKTKNLTHDYTQLGNDYDSTKCLIGVLLEHFESSGGLVSGEDTARNSANLEIHLSLSAAPTSTEEVVTFVAYDSVLKIQNGQVTRVY